jgi:protein-S-isoprenylcysteine O-methyltransferase Ste14
VETAAPNVLLVLLLVSWFALEVRQSRRTRSDGTSADRGSLWVLRATTLLGFLAAATAAVLVPSAALPQTLAEWGSPVLVASGMALRLWSFATLGRYFTFSVHVSDEQPVIVEGPYRFVRHPSYLGMLLALTGVAILFESWLSLLVFEVFTVSGLAYRISVEERALSAALGPRWTSYAADTRRLVPGIW